MAFKFLIIPALFISLLGCSSEQSSTDTPIEEIPLPASTIAFGTDTALFRVIVDNSLAIFEHAGGAKLVESDLHEKKCNRYMLTYQLNKSVKDSATLIEIVNHLGHKWHLQNIEQAQSSCSYKPMTSLFLYPKSAKEFYGAWVAMIAFNPDHPQGAAQVSTWNLK